MILLLACARPTPAPAGPGDTAGDWYASPPPTVGATVQLWAAVDPFTEVVSGWDGVTLSEWNGEVAWPEGEVEPVKQAVVVHPDSAAFEGRSATTWSPAGAPTGTILFFHGAAYDETMLSWLPAGQTLVRQAIRHGWRVIAPASAAAEASGTGGWSTGADLAWATKALASLKGRVVVMGMSSGGMFAHEVGAVSAPMGVITFCAPGLEATIGSTTTPTAWYLAAADTTWPDGEKIAAKAAARMEADGIPHDLYVHPQTPLYDARFTRAGLSLEESTALAATIRAEGYYTDGWTTSGGAVDVDASPAALAEIEIMAADHELYDDAVARSWAWIEGLLGR